MATSHKAKWASVLLTVVLLASACSKTNTPPVKPPENADKQVTPDDEVVITVVQTNDVHGYIMPQRASIAVDEEGLHRYSVDIGGVEWLAGYLDILREKTANRVIVVDSGDMFQGTMISNEFEGVPVIAAMNHLGYHAAAVGNHEFDFGPVGITDEGDPYGALKALGKVAEFPLLAANLMDRRTGQLVDWEGFAPYTIIELDGLKVALIGGPTVETPKYSKKRVASGLEFLPLAETLVKYSKEVRSKGADIVIGVLHAGGVCEEIDDENDLSTCSDKEELFAVANELPPGTVDLLLGAHTHRIIRHIVNGIPCLESGAKGKLFGLAEIHYSRSKKKVTGVKMKRQVGICHYHFVETQDCVFLEELPSGKTVPATFMGETVAARPFFSGLLSPQQKTVQDLSQTRLGPIAEKSLYRTTRGEDLPMGLLLTHVLMSRYPIATIGLFNESGIRASLPEGPITMEDVFRCLPFDSTPAFVKLSGKQLLDLLRLTTSGAHGGPVIRGLKVVVDRTRDECISNDWDKNGTKEKWERNLLVSATLADGSPINPDAKYTIITTSYLAGGGSDLDKVLGELPKEAVWHPDESKTVRELLVEWLKGHPTLRLGGPKDVYSRSADGPLVKTLNPDHIPGTTCGK
jgi:5'-nucleotidase